MEYPVMAVIIDGLASIVVSELIHVKFDIYIYIIQ